MPPITNQMLNCGESTAASTSVIDRSKLHGYLTGSLSTVLWWSCHCSIDGAGTGLISSLDCTRLENCHQANIEHIKVRSRIRHVVLTNTSLCLGITQTIIVVPNSCTANKKTECKQSPTSNGCQVQAAAGLRRRLSHAKLSASL